MSLQQRSSYPCVRAAAAAISVGDNGRGLHELPWLYLDSVGQEYGPVPGWTMREWLSLGRFPVGGELRVRLPEWERHLPLHRLFPDLGSAFLLPPSWPDFYSDGERLCEDPGEGRGGAAAPEPAAGAGAGAGAAAAAAEGSGAGGAYHRVVGAAGAAGAGAAGAGGAGGAGARRAGSLGAERRVPASAFLRLAAARAPAVPQARQERPKSPTPPQPRFVLEKLLQEEQLLPPQLATAFEGSLRIRG